MGMTVIKIFICFALRNCDWSSVFSHAWKLLWESGISVQVLVEVSFFCASRWPDSDCFNTRISFLQWGLVAQTDWAASGWTDWRGGAIHWCCNQLFQWKRLFELSEEGVLWLLAAFFFCGTVFEHLMSSQSPWIQCPRLENGLVIVGKCLVLCCNTEVIVDSIGS